MQATLSGGFLLLLLGSWRLWTPQTLFPRVPLISHLAGLPGWLDTTLTWIMLAAWICISAALIVVRSQSSARRLVWGWITLFLGMILLDQHRMQPWGVHIGMALLLVTSLPPPRARCWLIYLTASIYIYSAISKFDAQFLHTVGQDFLRGLLNWWDVELGAISTPRRLWLASLFPLGELACGLAVCWSVTQRWALGLSLVMHALLLMVLGPWGLGHSWGVLLWNLLFIAQNTLLLGSGKVAAAAATDEPLLPGWTVAELSCILIMLLPLGERWGVTDHWLGWALYAPHSSRAIIEVNHAAPQQLPPSVASHLSESDQPGWWQLSVDRWSLQTLGVPVYPQQRFYVGVADAVSQPLDEFGIRVTLLSAADRFTGRRTAHQLNGKRELRQAAGRYWWGTTSRKL